MAKPFRVAVAGGTFDRFHVGHARLLEAAAALADEVRIGVTTAGYLTGHPKPFSETLQPYETRRRAVVRHLRAIEPRVRYRVVPLEDPYGGSLAPGIDVLVASDESLEGARSVNRERRLRRLPPLVLRTVPLVLGEDLRPVSSRRIRAGVIDRSGRRRTAIRLALIGPATSNLPAVTSGARQLFGTSRLTVTRHSPGTAMASLWSEGVDYAVRLSPRSLEVADPAGPVGRSALRGTRTAPVASALRKAFGGRRAGVPGAGKSYRRRRG